MLEWLFGKKKEQVPPAPKKSSAQQQAEDVKWKYDFLVQFLSGPVWKVSILDFVDYHCVVFDSEEENKFEYTTIHNKFKQLVADLFDGMMSEVGLDEDKLAELLDKGFQSKHKKIFNQLLLADDFLRFKQLMVSRNKTLEAEAVKALAEQGQSRIKQPKLSEQDVLRESQRLEDERRRKLEEEEEEQLRKVLEMSKIEAEEQSMIKSLEEKAALRETQQVEHKEPELPQPIAKQPEHKVQQPLPQPEPKVEEKPQPIQEVQPEPAPSHIRHKPKKNLPALDSLPPLRQTRKQEEPRPEPIEQKPEPIPVPAPEEKVEVVEKVEVQAQQDRKKRLLEQRERIRRKKEEERKKQLVEEEGKPTHVQTIVLQEDGIHDTQHGEVQKEKVSQDEIDRRRELMKKIKNRIVDDF